MIPFSHRVFSDVFNLENIVQQTGVVHSKNILIDMLRNIFSQDRHFKYVQDVFGFPKTPSQLGLSSDAGIEDEETTRIFIGSSYRYDLKFNPSLIIRNSNSKYDPISFNQNMFNVVNTREILTDGYGAETVIYTPSYSTIVGAWDQSFEIKVIAESEMDREELADIVQVTLIGSRRNDLQRAGLFIRSLSSGGEQEVQYGNDYLYTMSINLETRSEWKIYIPISNVCERIGLSLTFKTMDGENNVDAFSVNELLITHADLL